MFGKRLLNNGFSNPQTLFARFGMALVVLVVLALVTQPAAFAVEVPSLGKIAALALIAGILGMTAYYYGLRRVPAHIATLAELFFPVAAIAVNYVAFGATITATQAVGAALITGAALLAQHKAVLPEPVGVGALAQGVVFGTTAGGRHAGRPLQGEIVPVGANPCVRPFGSPE